MTTVLRAVEHKLSRGRSTRSCPGASSTERSQDLYFIGNAKYSLSYMSGSRGMICALSNPPPRSVSSYTGLYRLERHALCVAMSLLQRAIQSLPLSRSSSASSVSTSRSVFSEQVEELDDASAHTSPLARSLSDSVAQLQQHPYSPREDYDSDVETPRVGAGSDDDPWDRVGAGRGRETPIPPPLGSSWRDGDDDWCRPKRSYTGTETKRCEVNGLALDSDVSSIPTTMTVGGREPPGIENQQTFVDLLLSTVTAAAGDLKSDLEPPALVEATTIVATRPSRQARRKAEIAELERATDAADHFDAVYVASGFEEQLRASPGILNVSEDVVFFDDGFEESIRRRSITST